MSPETQQEINNLKTQIEDLQRTLASDFNTLKTTLSNHTHTGVDNSRAFDTSINLTGSNVYRIGDSISMSANAQSLPSFLSLIRRF